MDRAPRWIAAVALLGSVAACEAEPDPAAELETDAELEQPDTAARPAGAGQGALLRVDSLAPGAVYLTDAGGRALYLIEGAPADSATCYDACAEEWPPFLAPEGSPRAGAPQVQEGLVGTIQRRGGETQVTYDGHALYYYHDDAGPGEATGQDVTDRWGEWYLVTPEGRPLEREGG